ncbi:hypothetical protein [Croceivirga sp. JEA036]|nr:hypothetical protein [Croceivirga sp. JEA036]
MLMLADAIRFERPNADQEQEPQEEGTLQDLKNKLKTRKPN